ncbi:sterol desaturase family protein [Streptomyces sp. V4-01]|uniref:Sterol desaturase family protein n=1 Tax=Actinacidiphila polyblastidii TaxID=3110430 RepID=A0ABU7PGC1_9ACTN|nr:sterol desaturase family protein [Streptomyces sp. V4-01]
MTLPHTDRAQRLRASPPVFRSPFLDRFTRVHPAVPVLLYGPVVVLLAVLALARLKPATFVGDCVLGYGAWTLTEYWVHRAVFHFSPRGPWGERLHWVMHGIHHDHPNDPRRLVMPPLASLPIIGSPVGVMLLVLGAGHGSAAATGYVAGYVVYDELHFHLHHDSPSTALGRRLRNHHLRHHFQDDSRGFGISCPYWDHVFATAPKRRAPANRPCGARCRPEARSRFTSRRI